MQDKITILGAGKLLEDNFGIKTAEIKEMYGYYDQNFYVKDGGANEYVFKKTSRDSFDCLDFQNKMMRHLGKKGLPVPKPIISLSGREIIPVKILNKASFVRLLAFMPGKPVARNCYNEELLENIGVLCAQINRALQDFSHPASHRPDFVWDLQNASLLRDYIDDVDDSGRFDAVNKIILLFEKEAKPLYRAGHCPFRKGVVHNDINEFNILSDDGKNITALIDFGDSCYTCHINDLAVSMAHFMLRQEDPVRKASCIYKGYQKIIPLPEEEKKILPLLVMTRLATLIVMSYHTTKENPNIYVRQQINFAWDVLKAMLSYSSEEILKQFEGNV